MEKNQEFRIDAEAGVVVFLQKSHGKVFSSITKASSEDKFNIGIGQLITMKRNEIAIRKVDIKSMLLALEDCKASSKHYEGTTAHKLFMNFTQIVTDKINMSRNHIRELRNDLDALYNGTYEVKPYAEIIEEHKKVRNMIKNGDKNSVSEIISGKYSVPTEIIEGTHIFDFEKGKVVLKAVE